MKLHKSKKLMSQRCDVTWGGKAYFLCPDVAPCMKVTLHLKKKSI